MDSQCLKLITRMTTENTPDSPQSTNINIWRAITYATCGSFLGNWPRQSFKSINWLIWVSMALWFFSRPDAIDAEEITTAVVWAQAYSTIQYTPWWLCSYSCGALTDECALTMRWYTVYFLFPQIERERRRCLFWVVLIWFIPPHARDAIEGSNRLAMIQSLLHIRCHKWLISNICTAQHIIQPFFFLSLLYPIHCNCLETTDSIHRPSLQPSSSSSPSFHFPTYQCQKLGGA